MVSKDAGQCVEYVCCKGRVSVMHACVHVCVGERMRTRTNGVMGMKGSWSEGRRIVVCASHYMNVRMRWGME